MYESGTVNTDLIAQRYEQFAEVEAQCVSAAYERLARSVARSPTILAFLATVPERRQQPNLFLAAIRHVAGLPENERELVQLVNTYGSALREVMLSRTTQTNEPARCAAFLPILANLPQPLALLEVGASAGLCLFPDRYSYDYGRYRVPKSSNPSSSIPVFKCDIAGTPPKPEALPTVVWRRGIDLNPLSVSSEDDVAWLETLVWPEQEHRLTALRAAISIAREDPPRVRRGNLLTDLDPLIFEAPPGATLVIFHTAVLSYISDSGARLSFARKMKNSPAIWISNESPNVFPDLLHHNAVSAAKGRFALMVNGQPVAWTGPHGQSLDWFKEAAWTPPNAGFKTDST